MSFLTPIAPKRKSWRGRFQGRQGIPVLWEAASTKPAVLVPLDQGHERLTHQLQLRGAEPTLLWIAQLQTCRSGHPSGKSREFVVRASLNSIEKPCTVFSQHYARASASTVLPVFQLTRGSITSGFTRSRWSRAMLTSESSKLSLRKCGSRPRSSSFVCLAL